MTLRIDSPLSAETETLIHRVIGSAIRVHTALRPGLLERVYLRALCVDFDAEGISYDRECRVDLSYRGQPVYHHHLDLVVGGEIVIEVKAVERLLPVHHAQLLGYLHAAQL